MAAFLEVTVAWGWMLGAIITLLLLRRVRNTPLWLALAFAAAWPITWPLVVICVGLFGLVLLSAPELFA